MYKCPHCGKLTYIGGRACNHCAKAFTIEKLEDVTREDEYASEAGKRVVVIDDQTAFVVMLVANKPDKKTKKTDPPDIAITEFRRASASAGWQQATSFNYPAAVAGEIAASIAAIGAS
jgi:hypothetical protein